MRVCILSLGHDCVDDRLYFKEARSIASRHHVVLIAPCLKGRLPSHPNIEYRPLPARTGMRTRLLMLPKALLMARSVRPDVIHVIDYELILIAPFLRLLTGARLVYDIWEANYEMMAESERLPRTVALALAVVFRAIERQLCRYCDLIVTADCEIAKAYRDVANVVVVKNYPILALCTTDPERVQSLRARYHDRCCLIYVGSMTEQRGLYLMLEIVELLREKVPSVTLLLVGQLDDAQRDRVTRTIREKTLEPNVDVVGWVPFGDVANYVAISEIGLIPFLRTAKFKKNIPQKQFEYMACGIPVVGTDLPPIAQYVREADCGRLVSQPRPEDFVNVLVSLLENGDERRIMGLRGKQAVAEKWNWDKMEERLFEAYDGLDAQVRQRRAGTGRGQRRSVSSR